MRIGVLGGTFDPIHNGHLSLAIQASDKMALEKVLLVPANHTPLKERSDILPAAQRVKMIKLAIKGENRLEFCEVELQRRGLSYTVDTLIELKKKLHKEDEIFFLMGWDSLMELPEWKTPQKLIGLCRLVIFNRPGVKKPDLLILEKSIPGLSRRIDMLEMPPLEISSTEIRRMVRQGLSIHNMVPIEVEQYIWKHRLYLE